MAANRGLHLGGMAKRREGGKQEKRPFSDCTRYTLDLEIYCR